jgi:acyl carrier protein
MNLQEATDLVARLVHGVAPEVDLRGAPADALLQEEFDLDSMDFLHLMEELEHETGIEVPERDYPLLATVGGFAGYVVDRSSGAA